MFEHVGLDYAGPFILKLGNTRKPTFVKAYICLFVCMSVKAIHLELISDLTTEAFLSTLKRLVARRGIPLFIAIMVQILLELTMNSTRFTNGLRHDMMKKVSLFSKNQMEIHTSTHATFWWPIIYC